MRSDERPENFLKWLHAEHYPHPSHPPLPFITISPQVGTGGPALARLLASQLNLSDPGDTPWAVWDRELVERVAAEEHVPPSVIDELEERRGGSWLSDLLSGRSSREDPGSRDRVELYRRMAGIIRAVARVGRAVLVGHGSVFVTDDLPGGVHVRLVAPIEHRISRFAAERSLPREQASAELHRIERERLDLYHRIFPGKPLLPEQFTITLNAATVSEPKQAASILALLRARESQNVADADAAHATTAS